MSTASRVLFALAIGLWVQPAPAQVTDTAYQALPHSSYVVFRGQVKLPSEGTWDVRSASDEAIVQLYRLRPLEVEQRQVGRRMQTALRERRIEQAQWRIRSLQWACLKYAQEHDGVGPAALQDLDSKAYRYQVENLQRSPWPDLKDANDKEYEGPFVFLVPQARFQFSDQRRQRVAGDRREVLAVELRPYVDDGQHWVMYTDGTCQREPVRQELVTAHGLQIRPIFKPSDLEAGPPTEYVRYTLIAVRRDAERRAFDVVLLNPSTGQQQTHRWDPAEAPVGPDVLQTLAAARREAWQPYLRTGPAPVLHSWAAFASGSEPSAGRGQRPGDNLSMFALLGGRAAVEETLQMQVLRPSDGAQRAETVEVTSLPGVQVKAHPYEQLLAGQPGGQLQLAEAAPADRFFVYVAKPDAILPFLDQGAGFLATTGAMLSGNRLDYDSDAAVSAAPGSQPHSAGSGAAFWHGRGSGGGAAGPVPDRRDGDDGRGTFESAAAGQRAPATAGRGRLLDTPMLAINTPDGRSAYWALRDDMLCLSSSRGELQRVLQQIDDQGEGSLGRSAEFRYMLTQLPVTDQTRVYAYFSDPFVRRLVGPEVKLSQARRTRARARMEYLTAQMLRARLDGVSPSSVQDLQQMGYLPAETAISGYTLNPQGQLQSDVYGSLARINTLPEVPLDRVTPAEAEAYERYVDEYSRYWREFFDPIAVRLSDTPQGTLELTTFILPLIDSSVYNRLREAILHAGDQRPLIVPQLDPSPICSFP